MVNPCIRRVECGGVFRGQALQGYVHVLLFQWLPLMTVMLGRPWDDDDIRVGLSGPYEMRHIGSGGR